MGCREIGMWKSSCGVSLLWVLILERGRNLEGVGGGWLVVIFGFW